METKTLSQQIKELQEKGFTANFDTLEDSLVNLKDKTEVDMNDFEVDEYYRFEGMTNPSDASILYAIHTKDGTKGTLVESYGASSSVSKAIAKKLKH